MSEVIASGPQSSFLQDIAPKLKPGGKIVINANRSNPFGKLPSAAELEELGLRVIQNQAPLDPRFSKQVFCRQTPREDGTTNIDPSTVRTTILEKV